jgi:uncharacterized protein (TIGR03437 family)
MRRILCGIFLLAIGFAAILAMGIANRKVSAQATPTPYRLVPMVLGLSFPVLVTNAGDGSNRLFIVERQGNVLVVPAGANAPLPTPFLSIIPKVMDDGGEQGLLGLAFHPQYETNGRFFVNYVRRPDSATVISEFKVSVDPNVALPDEKILLVIPQPFGNHKGGGIEFGPDGMFYIGMGDGGSGNDPGNRAQNIEELLGKFLRINVDVSDGINPYSSPADNPFVGKPGRDEIFAVGMRNPFRWSFDRATGELYAGDVGQNAIEEVDIITLGGNYGWRVLEGTLCTNLGPASCAVPGFTPPIIEYDRRMSPRCSVIGGYVYRGTAGTMPVGTYVFSDVCSGEILTWTKGTDPRTINVALDTNLAISSFGEDEGGELYAVDLNFAPFAGGVYKIASPSQLVSVSAANYRGDSVAPEAITAAFGVGLAATSMSAPGGPSLPTTLGDVTIIVRDSAGVERAAPIFFVSAGQLNFQIPVGTAPGVASISTRSSLGSSGPSPVNIAGLAPGLFTKNAMGTGLSASVVLRRKADGSQSFEPTARFDAGTNQFVPVPIDLGAATDQVFLVPFGTGFRNRSATGSLTAMVGGAAAQVTFAGPQGDFFGVDQANILLPRTLIGRGVVDVILTIDGMPTNTVQVTIQ